MRYTFGQRVSTFMQLLENRLLRQVGCLFQSIFSTNDITKYVAQ